MTGNFSDRLVDVIRLSREEALRLGHDYIGTEHLLLGILRKSEGVAIQILRNLDCDLTKLKKAIEAIAKPTGATITLGNIPLTVQAEKALKITAIEAKIYKANIIGTEHLLLSLLRDEESIATLALHKFKIFYDNARNELNSLLEGKKESQKPIKDKLGSEEEKIKTPVLDNFTIDITKNAEEEFYYNRKIFGREQEINSIILIFLKSFGKKSALLIGNEGIGKRAIVEGLAQKLFLFDVPEVLWEYRLVQLDIGKLFSASDEQVDKRINAIVEELEKDLKIILFIEDVNYILNSKSSKVQSFFNTLQFVMNRLKTKFIFSASIDAYDGFFINYPSIEHNLQVINITSLSSDDSIKLLKALKNSYENIYNVIISDEIISNIVTLSQLYMPSDSLPTKAISLLDESLTLINLQKSGKLRQKLIKVKLKIKEIEKRKVVFVKSQDWEEAAKLRDEQKVLNDSLKIMIEAEKNRSVSKKIELDEDTIIKILSQLTNISEIDIKNRENIPVRIDINAFHLSEKGVPNFEKLQTGSVLHEQKVQIARGVGFVLLPHNEEFQGIFDGVIRPAMEANGLKALKADDIFEPGAILAQVWKNICCAEVLIADMSGQNPNVIFELGLCYGVSRCPILLVRDPSELPFNLRSLRYIEYENSAAGSVKLKEKLTVTIQEFLAAVRAKP